MAIWRYYAGWALDAYIMGWVILEVLILAVGLPWIPGIVLAVLAGYRLVEIVQVFANGILFDRRRSLEGGYVQRYMVLSVPRSIIHSVVLLAESVACFAILFYVGRDSFAGSGSPGLDGAVDALDISMRTLTTVGPAAHAHGTFRLFVDLEPFVGLLFGGTVLARVINAMPRVEDTQQALER